MRPIKYFITSELDFYRNECNFTDEERMYFDMKARDFSDTKVSLEMSISISKVNKLSKIVRDKMNRVDLIYNMKK